MRVLHVIFTALFAALAILGGLVAAAVVAAVGLAIVFVRRLLGKPPALKGRLRDPAGNPPRSDVIEVTATDVTPAESPVNRIAR